VIDNIGYPFKVWITSVLVGPLLFIALILMFDADNNTIFNGIYPLLYILSVAVGGLISFPCFLILWLCYHLLIKYNLRLKTMRVCLLIISLVCCITVLILFSSIDPGSVWKAGNIRLIAAYTLPLAFGVTIYKLDEQKAWISE
jgi:hypothetical protein